MATNVEAWREDAKRLFTLFALNCAIRDDDAHLKDFALVYDDVLGTTRCALSPAKAAEIREKVADAMAETLGDIAGHAAGNPEFSDVASRMSAVWEDGIRTSLGFGPKHAAAATGRRPA